MDLFRTLLRGEGRSSPAERRPVLKAWRRILRSVLIIDRAAHYQKLASTLLALVAVPQRPLRHQRPGQEGEDGEDEEELVVTTVTPEQRPSCHEDLNFVLVRGARKKYSKRATPPVCVPADCSHPPGSLEKGGNGYRYWETCLACHTQWERVPVRVTDSTARSSSSAAAPTVTSMAPPCPNCNKQTILRQNRVTGEYFWGCKQFPKCRPCS
jgi:hypothetical protein